MNGIIVLSDGACNLKNCNIKTQGDKTTANITIDYINLNIGGYRTLSVLSNPLQVWDPI